MTRLMFGTIVLSTAVVARADARCDPPQSFKSFLTDGVSIAQSLKDKNKVGEPAFFHLTLPKDGTTSKETAGAIAVNLLCPDPEIEWSIAAEFHENNLIEKRQNVLAIGTTADWLKSFGPVEKTTWISDLQIKGGFKGDNEKHAQGVTASAYWTATAPRGVCRYCPDLEIASLVSYTPHIGIEYDNVLTGSKPEDELSVTRFFTDLNVYVLPFSETLHRRVVLNGDVEFRRDLHRSMELAASRNHTFRQFRASVFLDPYKIFSLGVEHISGENPDENFEEQQFTRLGLQVQLGKGQKNLLNRK
jgi:hypothetical protein